MDANDILRQTMSITCLLAVLSATEQEVNITQQVPFRPWTGLGIGRLLLFLAEGGVRKNITPIFARRKSRKKSFIIHIVEV